MARPSLLRTTTLLTGAHLGGVLLSFLEIPILARGLGAHAYGQLVWLQAVGLMAALGIEYGFNVSALRQLAVVAPAERPAKAAELWPALTWAKCLLATVVLPLACMALWWGAPADPWLWLASLLYALCFGFSPYWLLQGLDRMGTALMLDLICRVLGLLLLWHWVEGPQDLGLALWIMVGSTVASAVSSQILAWHLVGPWRRSRTHALSEIRAGWHVFVYRSASNLMLSSTVAILGLVAGPSAVTVFAPGEKLFKGIVGLSAPVLNAFMPHVAQKFAQSQRQGAAHAGMLLAALAGAGVLAAVLLSWFGPQLLLLLFGPGFEAAGQLLLVMAWLVPLRLLTQGLGSGVLIPAGHDRSASLALVTCSLLALAFGAWLAMGFAASGMLAGVMAAECLLVAWLVQHAWRHRLLVWPKDRSSHR